MLAELSLSGSIIHTNVGGAEKPKSLGSHRQSYPGFDPQRDQMKKNLSEKEVLSRVNEQS